MNDSKPQRSPIGPALRVTVLSCLLFGAAYPVVVLGMAKVLSPAGAEGSLIRDDHGQIIGSERIAQAFTRPEWFWPRPSAVDYNASATGGSNLSPSNPGLTERVRNTIEKHRAAGDEVTEAHPLPLDLAMASGGGLDPDITLEAARFQAPRVAGARHLPVERIRTLIEAHAEGGMANVSTGASRTVNVLRLNLALIELSPES